MADFIAALKKFVDVEYETQVREVYRMWQQPIAVRVREGKAIADVEVVQVSWNRAMLHCEENLSKFREGDMLLLNRGDPRQSPRYHCTLEEERGTELIVSPNYPNSSFAGLSPGKGWVLDEDICDLRHILTGVLDTLAQSEARRKHILGMLRGAVRPQLSVAREREAIRLAGHLERILGLNASQREAFIHAYTTENYYLIQGPPGTGKTRVLAMIASALAGEGQRVLVTAFTHRAINNALRTIAKTTRYPHVFKVGQQRYAEDLVWEGGAIANYETFEHSPYRLQDGGFIVGGTCFALRTRRLSEVEFDTVIFDEAGQVTLPLAISGMLSGKRYIFIGDHKQMAPVIVGEHAEEWVTRSIFETLFQHAPGTMLDITYRMNAEITAFPSRRFYGGRLRPAPEVRGRRLKLARQPQRYHELLDPERPSIFAEMRHAERDMRAPEEARLAAELAAEILACGLSAHEIAIVAPFRAQGRLIRKYLHELVAQHDESLNDIVVDTVERIQGQEREVVIVSLTTSNPGYAAQCAEFYFQPNRLNVAITRPRVKRIVIGSPLLFQAKPEKPEHHAWVEHFRALHAESDVVTISDEG
jgi:DNA replication ATP-dependent helicase Dna2